MNYYLERSLSLGGGGEGEEEIIGLSGREGILPLEFMREVACSLDNWYGREENRGLGVTGESDSEATRLRFQLSLG